MELTPFSKKELAHKFQYIEFVERGQKMAMLNIVDKSFEYIQSFIRIL
jgi:hypothetical protein